MSYDSVLKNENSIPIIITTGYDDDQHQTDLADRTLIKPIIFSALLDALESCVMQREDLQ